MLEQFLTCLRSLSVWPKGDDDTDGEEDGDLNVGDDDNDNGFS